MTYKEVGAIIQGIKRERTHSYAEGWNDALGTLLTELQKSFPADSLTNSHRKELERKFGKIK
jgi:hypothetical protein